MAVNCKGSNTPKHSGGPLLHHTMLQLTLMSQTVASILIFKLLLLLYASQARPVPAGELGASPFTYSDEHVS